MKRADHGTIKPVDLDGDSAWTLAKFLEASGTLPYPRMPAYLSPTSFFELESNPDLFYLKRCGPIELKPESEPQANYFGVGSAFDYFIKVLLAARLGQLLPTDMYETQVEKHNRSANNIIPRLGLAAAAAYFDSPCFDRLFKVDGLHRVEDQVEPIRIEGVPLWGKPDASLWRDPVGVYAHDFKTTGAFSKNKKNPAPGYKMLWRRINGSWKETGAHKNAFMTMDQISESWAIQCVFYSWMLGRSPNIDCPCSIDQIVYNGADIAIAQYRSVVTVEFQQDLLHRLVQAWDIVQGKRVVVGPDPTWTMMMA
jgi:hypothetical protein